MEEETFSEEMHSKMIDLSGSTSLDAEDRNTAGTMVHVAENTSNGNGDDEEEQLKEEGKVEKNDDSGLAEDIPWKTRIWEVFTTFWPLGFVAFGGPQAHIAILRDHLVVQRDWMDEDAFTGE